jgi:hypothetical protein
MVFTGLGDGGRKVGARVVSDLGKARMCLLSDIGQITGPSPLGYT